MSARIRMGAWEQRRDDVKSEQLCKLQTTFRAGVTVRTVSCGNKREHSLKTSSCEVQKRAVKESLGMRKFVWICGVNRMSPLAHL